MTSTITPIQELTSFCETTYGVPAMETRILVSSFLPTRHPPIWIMIQAEPNRFSNDLAYCTRRLWANEITDTWYYRAERPRAHNKLVMLALEERLTRPRLFADRFWSWPGPAIRRTSYYPLLSSQCVRMRFNLDPGRFPENMMRDEMLERMKEALAAWPATRSGIVPEPPTETFSRRAMLLPLIDWMYKDRPALMRNLCFVPANHAAICGRTEVIEADLQAQAYVLRSCVPVWLEKIILVMLSYGAMCVSAGTIIADTGFENPWRMKGTRENPLRLGEKLVRELWTNGLVERNKKGRFRIKPEYVDDLEHIIQAKL